MKKYLGALLITCTLNSLHGGLAPALDNLQQTLINLHDALQSQPSHVKKPDQPPKKETKPPFAEQTDIPPAKPSTSTTQQPLNTQTTLSVSVDSEDLKKWFDFFISKISDKLPNINISQENIKIPSLETPVIITKNGSSQDIYNAIASAKDHLKKTETDSNISLGLLRPKIINSNDKQFPYALEAEAIIIISDRRDQFPLQNFFESTKIILPTRSVWLYFNAQNIDINNINKTIADIESEKLRLSMMRQLSPKIRKLILRSKAWSDLPLQKIIGIETDPLGKKTIKEWRVSDRKISD